MLALCEYVHVACASEMKSRGFYAKILVFWTGVVGRYDSRNGFTDIAAFGGYLQN